LFQFKSIFLTHFWLLNFLVVEIALYLNNNKTALSPAFATKAQPLNMLPVEGVDLLVNNAAAASSNVLLATSSSDFGGAFYPVAGIALLATLILYLSPPLSDS
jgi:hypothetical protein